MPVPLDAYADGVRGAGVPPDEVALITYLFGEVLDGRNASLADGVQRALGRAPRDFADYARDAAASGRVGRMSPALFGRRARGGARRGVNGGVFFAFSSFVMPALQRLPDAQGIAAMQSINVTAVRPPFMAVLFGTAALCLVLIVWAIARGTRPRRG